MQDEVEISIRKILPRQQNRWKPGILSEIWRRCELNADARHLRAGPLCMAFHRTVLYSDRMQYSKEQLYRVFQHALARALNPVAVTFQDEMLLYHMYLPTTYF